MLPDDRLPLDTMARDALVLGFPAFPLRRPDCAGLCPVCGADRNTVDCGHGGTEQLDPRWAGLADLRTCSGGRRCQSPSVRPRAKTRHRRSHWKSVAPTYASCPQCRQAKLPHTVCQNCGYYGGRQVVAVE